MTISFFYPSQIKIKVSHDQLLNVVKDNSGENTQTSRCHWKTITLSGHKVDFAIQRILHSLCLILNHSTRDLTNRRLCCLATSSLVEQGVNTGNRITQHVKNELGTTAHVWCNYSAYPWILVLMGDLKGF